MICPKCSQNFENNEAICPNCGYHLGFGIVDAVEENIPLSSEVNEGTTEFNENKQEAYESESPGIMQDSVKRTKAPMNWKRISVISAIVLILVFVLSFVTIKAFEFFQPLKMKYFNLEVDSLSNVVIHTLDSSDKYVSELEGKFNQDFVINSSMSFNLEADGDAVPNDITQLINPLELTLNTVYNKKSNSESNRLGLKFMDEELIDLNYSFRESDFLLQVPKLISKTLSVKQDGYKQTLENLGISEVDLAGAPDSLNDFRFVNNFDLENVQDLRELWSVLVKYHKVFYDNLGDDKVKLVKGTVFNVNGSDTKCNEYIVTFDNAYLKKCLTDVLDAASKDQKLLEKLKQNKLLQPLMDSGDMDIEEVKANINEMFAAEGVLENHVYEEKGKIIGRKMIYSENGQDIVETLSAIKFADDEKYFDLKVTDGGIALADVKFTSKKTGDVEAGTTTILFTEGNAEFKHNIKGLDTNESSVEIDFSLSDGITPLTGKLSLYSKKLSDKKDNADFVVSFNDDVNQYTFKVHSEYSAEPTTIKAGDNVLKLEDATQQDLEALSQEIASNFTKLMLTLPEPLGSMATLFSGASLGGEYDSPGYSVSYYE